MDLKAANPLLMADESIPAFLRGDLSPDGSISFSVLRYLYAVTLLVMNPSQLRRFWESLPLERNGVRPDSGEAYTLFSVNRFLRMTAGELYKS